MAVNPVPFHAGSPDRAMTSTTADPVPPLTAPLRTAPQTAEWVSADGAPAPWLLEPVETDDLVPRPRPYSTKLRIALLCSIGLHFAVGTMVATGLPHVDWDWLKLRDAPVKRVDVVFYDPTAPEEVARATGAVAQQQAKFGLGTAEERGRNVGSNPTPAEADNKPNARRVAQGEGQTGDGTAKAASSAAKTTANASASTKSDASQSLDGKDSRTEKAASARNEQTPSQPAPAAQPTPSNQSGGAAAQGQVTGKGKDDQDTTAQKQTASPAETAQQSPVTPTPAGEAQARPTSLASSLPMIEEQETGKPKQETAKPKREANKEPPSYAIVPRPQAQENPPPKPVTPPQEQRAASQPSETTKKLQERLQDLREDGGPSNLKLAVKTSAGDALLPATGTGSSNESGAAADAPKPSPSITPIRAAQAMQPAPAESSSTIAMKLMLQTMPGLDNTLAAAMAHPDTTPVLPPTPRREQVVARMQKAADRGYAHAQYGVARRELIGQGVPRDPRAAANLLERAARQGHATSQLTLGYMALKGYGMKQDKVEALTWLSLAANQGNGDAARAAALVEPTLTAQELIAARRSISDWKSVTEPATPPAATEGKSAPDRGPLQDAVAHGDVAAVRALVARGEDANGRDREGRTAMINAAWRGDTSIVDNLMEMGADPDIVDNEGRTAIMWAAGNGYPTVVEKLAKAGVELNLKDKEGRTALTSASLNGYTDVVKALIANKADLNARDDRGKTALDYAIRQNYPDLVQVLEKAGAKR